MPDRKPTLYVIAGPNGAGKTTFAMRYLPQLILERDGQRSRIFDPALYRAVLSQTGGRHDAAG